MKCELKEICGDWELCIFQNPEQPTVLFFNSRQNALNVKRIIEIDNIIPNAATVCDIQTEDIERRLESDYKYLQERLSKKSENNPYKYTGCCNYETGYKEGIAAAKSILSEFYHRREK